MGTASEPSFFSGIVMTVVVTTVMTVLFSLWHVTVTVWHVTETATVCERAPRAETVCNCDSASVTSESVAGCNTDGMWLISIRVRTPSGIVRRSDSVAMAAVTVNFEFGWWFVWRCCLRSKLLLWLITAVDRRHRHSSTLFSCLNLRSALFRIRILQVIVWCGSSSLLWRIFLMFAAAGNSSNIFTAILDELKKLNASHSFLQERVFSFHRDISQLSTVVYQNYPSALEEGRIHEQPPPAPSVPDVRWKCPVCLKTFMHKESFKGHIRKLVFGSSRPKCHLNPQNVEHQLLVHRFEGATFYDRSQKFCREFYSQTCLSCTKRDEDDQSYRHVSAWIDASKSSAEFGGEIPYPVYDPGVRSVSRKHPRTDSESSQISSRVASSSSIARSSYSQSSLKSSSSGF